MRTFVIATMTLAMMATMMAATLYSGTAGAALARVVHPVERLSQLRQDCRVDPRPMVAYLDQHCVAVAKDAQDETLETDDQFSALVDASLDRLTLAHCFEPCPSADNLRLVRRFAKGGSGSSGLEFRRRAADRDRNFG